MRSKGHVRGYVLLAAFVAIAASAVEPSDLIDPVPTYADAAVILAKFSGRFDRYVAPDADLNECVAFLNKTGIYFGLLEIVSGTEFKLKDCARPMGQIDLVLSGEAKYAAGKVKLPKGIATWEDYCILNDVDYVEAYRTIVDVVRMARASNE